MAFELPDLTYPYDALEPHIDELTMKIHHGKHHAGYVEKLNKALEGHSDLLSKPIEDLLREIESVPEDIRQNVINNGGGHSNHSIFWKIMSPDGGGEPEGGLLTAINSTFESFADFKNQFNEKASGVFGSGWAWLVVTADNKLELTRQSFQNSPYMDGNTPIFGIDVWEHAYYLKYQNKRAEYIEAFWQCVNWNQVSQNYSNAL